MNLKGVNDMKRLLMMGLVSVFMGACAGNPPHSWAWQKQNAKNPSAVQEVYAEARRNEWFR